MVTVIVGVMLGWEILLTVQMIILWLYLQQIIEGKIKIGEGDER